MTQLPFFAKGICPQSGTKDKVGAINEPINCGGFTINPGDIIVADRNGIVTMSKDDAVEERAI